MANYRIVNGELCSDDELRHGKFKYTYKVRKNGRWVYYYNGDEKKAKTGRSLIGKPEVQRIKTYEQGWARGRKLNEANKKETDKASAMDALYKKENSFKGKAQKKLNKVVDVANDTKKSAVKTSKKWKVKHDMAIVKGLQNIDKAKVAANKKVSEIKKDAAKSIDRAEQWIDGLFGKKKKKR